MSCGPNTRNLPIATYGMALTCKDPAGNWIFVFFLPTSLESLYVNFYNGYNDANSWTGWHNISFTKTKSQTYGTGQALKKLLLGNFRSYPFANVNIVKILNSISLKSVDPMFFTEYSTFFPMTLQAVTEQFVYPFPLR